MNYMMDKVEQIFQQAPEGISKKQISNLLDIHNGDSLMVLTILWKLGDGNDNANGDDDNGDVVKEEDVKKKKWDDIREICNSYEEEMQKFMQSKQK